MDFRKWFEQNIQYRFLGCGYYTPFNKSMFDFMAAKVTKEFLGREISDLGCGDGIDTLRLKQIFQAKSIQGFDANEDLLKRARGKGIEVQKLDLTKDMPKGEMATFSYCLHHLPNKEEVLVKAVKNFNYLVLAEPTLTLYRRIFHEPGILKREEWLKLFDKVLKSYLLYERGNRLIVFWKRVS